MADALGSTESDRDANIRRTLSPCFFIMAIGPAYIDAYKLDLQSFLPLQEKFLSVEAQQPGYCGHYISELSRKGLINFQLDHGEHFIQQFLQLKTLACDKDLNLLSFGRHSMDFLVKAKDLCRTLGGIPRIIHSREVFLKEINIIANMIKSLLKCFKSISETNRLRLENRRKDFIKILFELKLTLRQLDKLLSSVVVNQLSTT